MWRKSSYTYVYPRVVLESHEDQSTYVTIYPCRIKSKPVFSSYLETTRFKSLLLSPNTLFEPSPCMKSPPIRHPFRQSRPPNILFQ
jgi:hypothetical protein